MGQQGTCMAFRFPSSNNDISSLYTSCNCIQHILETTSQPRVSRAIVLSLF
jgi:hypothetical protein